MAGDNSATDMRRSRWRSCSRTLPPPAACEGTMIVWPFVFIAVLRRLGREDCEGDETGESLGELLEGGVSSELRRYHSLTHSADGRKRERNFRTLKKGYVTRKRV